MSPAKDRYRFHAAELSLFSAKLRPALRYKQLHYEELRPDLAEIKRRTGLIFIPILITPEDETWQDTSDILDRLEARHPDPPLYPKTPAQRIACSLVELYSDEFGLAPAMQTRWGTPSRVEWARARFSALFGPAAGNMAADTMIKRRDTVGVSLVSAPALEAHIVDLLAATSAHFETSPYLLGERMSLADCALMGPLHGHFFTDLESRMQMLETAVPTAGWIDRCNIPNTDQQGEWLADDALAPSFVKLLSVMASDAVTPTLAWIADVETWLDENPKPQGALPRAVGTTHTQLRGVEFTRVTLPYSLWMLQRTLDAYHGFDEEEREQIDTAFAGTGWEPVLAYRPRHRIEKSGFDLALVR